MGSYSVRLLAQVVAGLEARQLDGGGAQRLAAAALELDGTQDGVWAQLNGRQQRKLRQLLHQLAERATQLSSRLTAAEVAAPSATLRSQVHATCVAVLAGLRAAHMLQLEADEGFHLCSALALALRAGSSCAAVDSTCWLVQLDAMATAITLEPGSSPEAAQFASTAAQPAALLPWLVAAARGLGPICHGASPGAAQRIVAGTFVRLAGALLIEGRYAAHRRALAANPALARPLAAFLLQHCLPAVAAGLSGLHGQPDLTVLGPLASAVNARCMEAAVGSYVQHSDAAAAAVEHAAAIVEHLPQVQPGSIDRVSVEAYSNATGMLGKLCDCMRSGSLQQEAAEQLGGGNGSGSSGSSGGSGGSSSSGGNGSSHTDDGDSSGGSSRSDDAGSGSGSDGSRVVHMKAAACALLRVLPKVLAFIEAACAEGSPLLEPAASCSSHREAASRAFRQLNLASTMNALWYGLGLVGDMRCYVAAPAEFHLWLDAAEAGVRLQPTLTRLHRHTDLAGRISVPEAAQRLAHKLATAVWAFPQPLLVPLGDLEDEAAAAQRASLGNRLWRLHSTSCRWLHSMLAQERQGGGQAAAFWEEAPVPAGRLWGALLFSLNLIFERAYEAMLGCQEDAALGPTAAAQLAALCAGHWNALEAMAAAADATGGLVVLDQHQWAVLLRAYQRIAATCPYLATPAFFHPLRPL